MNRLLILGTCILIFILIVSSSVFYKRSEILAEDKLLMPKGLEGIYLGMSLEELKKIKPNLIRGDVWTDFSLYGEAPFYVEENLKNNFFSLAYYEISNGKLVEIELEKLGPPDFLKSRVPGLIKGCIKKWGSDYRKRIGMVKNEKPLLYPVFSWEKPGAKIIMRYIITSNEKDSPNHFRVFIFKPERELKLDYKDIADQKELKEVFKDIQATETYTGPIFE